MKKQTIGVVFLTLALVLLGSSVSFASDVRATLDEGGIGFEADATYRSLSVRITGEGKVVNRVFQADAFAYISPADFDLPDGQYRYEAVLTPDNENLGRRVSRSDRGTDESLSERNVISGSFRIDGGAIVLDRGEAEPASPAIVASTEAADANGLVSTTLADQIINDDLIVTFSACVGNDCVNGENFGFDTLRLKENNLRLHFDDTSVAASFPANDWRLIANDSSNGGDNFFAIEDATLGRQLFRVEAGAPANSLFVDNSGNVGVGTGSPVVELHVVDGDTPTLRLEQNGSAGFQPQTWDLAGNETNFFIRDATNGSKLPFRIRPGAPDSSIDIAADGDVGVGTSSPQASLHVRRTNGTAQILIEEASTTPAARGLLTMKNAGGTFITMENTAASTTWFFTHENNAPNRFLMSEGTNSAALALSANGDMTLAGTLTTNGPTCTMGCDAVFREDYPLPTIEEHAEAMYGNSYLPGVGPTTPELPLNVTEKLGGMLNELEKAHIYVHQLNEEVKVLKARLQELEAKDAPEH